MKEGFRELFVRGSVTLVLTIALTAAVGCVGAQPVEPAYGRPPSEAVDAEGCPQGGAAGTWPAHCTGRYNATSGW